MKYVLLFICHFVLLPSSLFAQNVDELEISNLFTKQFINKWQSSDPKGLASLWHEEGDWMSLIGSRGIYKGHKQIEQVWSIGLQSRLTVEQRKLTIEIDSIILHSPMLAHVDLVMTFGHARTGLIREAMFAIMQNGKDGWKIKNSRVSRISSTPAEG